MYIKSESYLCKIFRSHILYISCQNPRHFCPPGFSLWVFSWIWSISVCFRIPLTTTFSVFSILLVCFWTKPKRRKMVKCLILMIWKREKHVTWKLELTLTYRLWEISVSNVLLKFVLRSPNCTLAPDTVKYSSDILNYVVDNTLNNLAICTSRIKW